MIYNKFSIKIVELLFISKYSALHRFLNNSRTQSVRNLRFSLDERQDLRTSFLPIFYTAKSFLNQSLLQNIAKSA